MKTDGPLILVVEDSLMQREVLKRTLTEAGYNTLAASDGSEGLELTKKFLPTLVITDIAMPRMNGYELCRSIKNSALLKNISVILLTELSEPEDIINGLECDADNFILKPYNNESLFKRIDYLLATKDLMNEEVFEFGIEFNFAGKSYIIKSDRRQILNLLLSTYESALCKSRELVNAQSELKDKTRELEQLNRNLEQRVTEEINKRMYQQELLVQQSKLAAMGEMIGAIAHQWRQPLTSIGLIIQDIEDAHKYNELDKQYISNSVKSAMDQVQFMSSTIDNFRNFFRPNKEKSQFDIIKAINEVLFIISSQLKNNTILLIFKCTCSSNSLILQDTFDIDVCKCGIMSVEGYLNEFKQAMLNVLNNSKDAIVERREKGYLGNKEKGEIEITVSHREIDDHIIITVTDNGGGISEDIMDRIFEPYFSTKTDSNGTGIGLYMSKTIIETNMNGKLYAESTRDKTTFTIELKR